MKIGPLYLLERGHCNGDPARHWMIASWHWRWSITWRWLLWWVPSWRFWQGWYFAKQKNMPWRKPCTCHPDDNPPRTTTDERIRLNDETEEFLKRHEPRSPLQEDK